MFVRIVTWNLKPGQRSSFARALDEDAIPLLRKFNGFKDVIALVSADGKQAVGMSFWQQRSDAENYSRAAYQDVLKMLADSTEGTPTLKEYEVTNSTVHDIKARKGGA